MHKKLYITFFLSFSMFLFVSSVAAQQQGGSIVLTNFGDSTYTTGMAGEFNFTDFRQGDVINVKGAYGDIATVVEVNVNYTIFATDWSSVLYDTVQVFASVDSGNIDGLIDYDFVIPMDADTFGVHDILDPETDTLITPAPTYVQVRVFHDVLPQDGGPDVFWFEFVRVRGNLLSSVNDFDPLEGLEIYPNPASDAITINTLDEGETNIMVYDISGRRVMHQELVGNRLDVSQLHSGFHIVRVEQNGKMGIVRVMIE